MERRNLEGTPAQVGEVVDRPSAAGPAAGDEAAGSSRLHDVRIVRWERFLPRRFLRVLLVEPDDSTRQIVAALLRKCGYRVVAVADGMKAWETLKETHFNCDLVLTEVTTPAISGIGLLSKIMTNDLCKNLPVIMMSSSDSVGVVFNCMLKGAADFLVKPVRKNELRNLWQHVWRRRSAGSGENICENETHVEEKVVLIPDNNIDGNRMCQNVVRSPKTGDSFKKSDSQSSCGQSGTQFRGEEVPHQIANKSICAETDLDVNNTIYEPETVSRTPLLNLVDNVHSTSPAATEQPSQAASSSKENHTRCDQITSTEENVGSTSCKYASHDPDHDTRTRTSEEVIDFIAGCREPHAFEEANYIDHRQRFSLGDEEHFDLSENAPSVATSPLCQTSLRNPCFGSWDKNEFHDNHILNHSDASAFSRYQRKGPHHVVKPNLASSSRLYIKGKDCHGDGGIVGSTSKGALRQSKQNEFESLKSIQSDVEKQSPCILIKETPVSGDSGTFSRKNENMGYPNFQLGSSSVPIPVGAVSLDSMCTSYSAFLQPVYYSEAGLSLWHPCIEQNTNEKNEGEHICECQSHCEYAHSTLHEQKTVGQDGGRDSLIAKPSTMVSSSVTNAVHRGIRSDLNENQNNGRSDEAVAAAAAAENDDFDSENHENCNSSGVHHDHSTHREAALTKFQLKRKNRCFEKKVRYFSRQKLAEQRPRMKGQFVRQADFGSKDENSNI